MEKTEKVMEKVMENHGIFCNLKSTNPAMSMKKVDLFVVLLVAFCKILFLGFVKENNGKLVKQFNADLRIKDEILMEMKYCFVLECNINC